MMTKTPQPFSLLHGRCRSDADDATPPCPVSLSRPIHHQMAVVAGHASSASGVLASKGAYQSTRVTMRAWNNLMSRNQTRETRAQVTEECVSGARVDHGFSC